MEAERKPRVKFLVSKTDVTIDLTVGNILHILFFLNYDYDDMVVA